MNNNQNGALNDLTQSQSAPTTQTAAKTQQTKKEVWYWWVIGALSLLVVGLGGYLIWQSVNQPVKHDKETIGVVDGGGEVGNKEQTALDRPNNVIVSQDDDMAVRGVVAELKKVATEELTYDLGNSGTVSAAIYQLYDYRSLMYRPEGVKTAIPLTRSYGFVVDETADEAFSRVMLSDQLVGALRQALKAQGFVEYIDSGMDYMYLNDKTGVICQLSEPSMPYWVTCSHIDWVEQETLGLVDELAEAYREKTGEYPFLLERIKVQDSSTRPYQFVQVSVGGAMGMFYRVNQDADWQFFKGTQMVLSCSEFGTDDLKKAFSDSVCYDESIDQTVKVSTLIEQ